MLLAFKDQGTKVEFTVAQKFNQGTPAIGAVIDGGASLVPFWASKKELVKNY